MDQTYDDPTRIALWSGPRNLSTAMMRSFGARVDTHSVDEPFYAAYLAITGLNHPMREEILAAHETDPAAVINSLAYAPSPAPIFYQKHMCHHMVEGIDRGWMRAVRHAFLIRHPARVLASYANKMETISLEAIGFAQQAELFDLVTRDLGQPPIVIDSHDLLRDPAGVLAALCRALGIEYSDAMMSWETGYHPQDGIWASHWYNAVIESSGFAQLAGDKGNGDKGAGDKGAGDKGAEDQSANMPIVSGEYAYIMQQAMPYYEELSQHRLKGTS